MGKAMHGGKELRQAAAVVLLLSWPPLAVGQTVFNVPPNTAPSSLTGSNTLNLRAGGTLPAGFDVRNSATLNVLGGIAGENLTAFNTSAVNLVAGAIGDNFEGKFGTSFTQRGGSLGVSAGVFGSAYISGGQVMSDFSAEAGSQVVITGGDISFGYQARSGSNTRIAGGNIGPLFNAASSSVVQLFGTGFTIGGAPIAGLNQSGDVALITQRGGAVLAGTLADGSPIDLTLSTFGGIDTVDQNATLIVTLHLSGDFDLNGVVDAADYATWKNQFGSSVSPPGTGADANFDGAVNAADYTLWRDRLGTSLPGSGALAATHTVPEPGGVWVALVFATLGCGIRASATSKD